MIFLCLSLLWTLLLNQSLKMNLFLVLFLIILICVPVMTSRKELAQTTSLSLSSLCRKYLNQDRAIRISYSCCCLIPNLMLVFGEKILSTILMENLYLMQQSLAGTWELLVMGLIYFGIGVSLLLLIIHLRGVFLTKLTTICSKNSPGGCLLDPFRMIFLSVFLSVLLVLWKSQEVQPPGVLLSIVPFQEEVPQLLHPKALLPRTGCQNQVAQY